MKATLHEKLNRYKNTISQQTIDPLKIKKIGLTSAAAMTAIITVPVDLSSQVVCGDLGAPTRISGNCVGGLGDLGNYYTAGTSCFQLDFDNDGTPELQVRYYNYGSFYPNCTMYLDPLYQGGTEWMQPQQWEVAIDPDYGPNLFPSYPQGDTLAFSNLYVDKIILVPLSGGSGFGFVAYEWNFDTGFGNNPHPISGQSIIPPTASTPIMWGGSTELSIADYVANSNDPDLCFGINALPVELSKFEAKANKESITLNWTTESEVNNSGFSIERSTDGREYRDIAFVDGQGDSQSRESYTYEDKDVDGGNTYYYRLRQIDYDGTQKLSKVEAVRLKSSKASVSVYPNPTQGRINVELQSTAQGQVVLSLFSSNGDLVKTESLTNSADQLAVDYDLTDLTNGVYYLKVETVDAVMYEKVTVQH